MIVTPAARFLRSKEPPFAVGSEAGHIAVQVWRRKKTLVVLAIDVYRYVASVSPGYPPQRVAL